MRFRQCRSAILCATILLTACLLAGCLPASAPQSAGDRPVPHAARTLSLLRYVDPFIGTIHGGNVFPGASMPHGMVQWSPDTSAGGLSMPGGYNDGDTIIRGFSLTHLSGAGCAAFGTIPFMPTVQPLTVPPLPNGSPYSASFRHADERASPGYYAVRLASGVDVRLAVTPRTGMGLFTYPAGARATMIVNPASAAGGTSNVDGASWATVQVGHNLLTGSATAGSFCGLHNRYTVYFAALFSRPFTSAGVWNDTGLATGVRTSSGPHASFVSFDTARGRTVMVKVGLSYVGVRNALANIQAENPGWSFPTVRRRAAGVWNSLLNRIQATGGTPASETVFYTALYHSLLQPTLFSDANGQYLGFDGRVRLARGRAQYANFSGWDIYRSEIQLLAILMPHETGDMMQSLVADAQQGGWLPKWPVANDYTGEMNGDSADPILAGAYAFGARGFDAQTALRFMLQGADRPGVGPRGYQERPGLDSYLRLGYVAPQTGGYGPAATTLEYAVDDFAIAQLARALGNLALYRTYLRRSEGWRRLFNAATGFLEPRFPDGSFPIGFDPSSMAGFVEGNASQYTWMVPQDLGGLFRLMGGNRRAAGRLDRYFARLNAGPTAPFHWAGNEPGLEVPWEYDFAGMPWRTQAVVRQIMTNLYTPSPGGLPGNDDLGAMSSWIVWAAIGLYPEIPAVPGVVLGSPLFPHITVNPPAGHPFTVDASHASPATPYVQSLRLNGRPYSRTWLSLSTLMGGAHLLFDLGGAPNTSWGSAPADTPPSFSP